MGIPLRNSNCIQASALPAQAIFRMRNNKNSFSISTGTGAFPPLSVFHIPTTGE